MKKMLLFLIVGILLFTFTGCGKQVASNFSTTDQNVAVKSPGSSNQSGSSEAPKDTPSETPKETPEETSKENTGALSQNGTQEEKIKEMNKKIDAIIDALFNDEKVSQLLKGGNVKLNFLSKDEKGDTAPVNGVWEIELQVNQKKVAVVKIRDSDMKIISVEK